MHLVILAFDKKSACVKKETKCRYCDGMRGLFHMETAHPELISRFIQNMRDEWQKEIVGGQDRISYRPKWHLLGKKI